MKPTRSVPRLSNRTSYTCQNHSSPRFLRPSTRCCYSTARNLPPLPPQAAYAPLPSRRLISISGPDAAHFLHGVITANISPSSPRTSGFYAAFLNGKGRLLNDVFVYPENTAEKEGWLIEVDAKDAAQLLRYIKRRKLRAKFDMQLLDEGERNVWSVWQQDGVAESIGDNISAEGKSTEGVLSLDDNRAPGMGRRLILPGGKKPEVDLEETTEESYTVRRYLKGVAEGQDELIKEEALPQESNIDYMGGIDYRKGCYVGQELTIRTHHTGVVRKRILPVMLYEKDEPMPAALKYSPGRDLATAIPKGINIGRFEKRGRASGKWLAGVGNIGLGLCRLEIMTDVVIQGEGGGYKEGDEFKLEWQVDGGDTDLIKIKAFIPSWYQTNK